MALCVPEVGHTLPARHLNSIELAPFILLNHLNHRSGLFLLLKHWFDLGQQKMRQVKVLGLNLLDQLVWIIEGALASSHFEE